MTISSQNVDYEWPLQAQKLTELDISGFCAIKAEMLKSYLVSNI